MFKELFKNIYNRDSCNDEYLLIEYGKNINEIINNIENRINDIKFDIEKEK